MGRMIFSRFLTTLISIQDDPTLKDLLLQYLKQEMILIPFKLSMRNDDEPDDIALFFIIAIYMHEYGINLNGIQTINTNQ